MNFQFYLFHSSIAEAQKKNDAWPCIKKMK